MDKRVWLDSELLMTGFQFYSGVPGVMSHDHRHKEIEMNFVESGSMTYLMSGIRQEVPQGRLAVFWAAIPHQVIRLDEATQFCYVHLPLAQLLQWRLPGSLTHALLRGELVMEQDSAQPVFDQAMFRRWKSDLQSPSPENEKIILLEMEARLRRLDKEWIAPGTERPDYAGASVTSSENERDKVERMAYFIAENYAENLKVEDIAQEVKLHPKYAMTLFRKTCGMTVLDYLTQHRLSQAQRLLATSDAKIVDIAFASGFGSVSRFYEVFEQACGQSPRAYRASLALKRGLGSS